jgi:hypothetical protein
MERNLDVKASVFLGRRTACRGAMGSCAQKAVAGNDAAGLWRRCMQRLYGWAIAHRGMEKKGLHAKTLRRKEVVGYAYATEPEPRGLTEGNRRKRL